MGRHTAVVGVGQTEAKSHWDLSLPGLYRLAAKRALEDAELKWKDIDAIVFGHSPEYFEGINHPEKWIAEAVGGFGKPVFRIHTGGTVGGSTAIGGYYAVASGKFDTVLAVSGNKLGDCAHAQAGLATVYDPIMGRQFNAGALSAVAIQSRLWMNKWGYDEKYGAMVAAKNRSNAMNNPYAHIQIPGYTVEMALQTPMISSPLRLSDCCPQSDAACAMIFQVEGKAKKTAAVPAWVRAAVSVSEGVSYVDRDWSMPIGLRKAAEIAYERSGIREPLKQLDVVEVYEAFSYQEMIWYEGLKLCDWGEGGRLMQSGATQMTGKLPVNPSGGVLSANSIGASAMVRKAEAAWQVMGKCGPRQIPDVKRALGHGWGGAIQFHTIMIFSREKP